MFKIMTAFTLALLSSGVSGLLYRETLVRAPGEFSACCYFVLVGFAWFFAWVYWLFKKNSK